jgi:hypothetical protein
VEVSNISTATQIMAGSSNSCAMLAAGKVNCWGSNSNGRLGNGSTTESNVPVEVSNVSTFAVFELAPPDTTAPAKPSAFAGVPSSLTNATGATITFTLGESGGTVECRTDSGSWEACTNVSGTAVTYTISGLADGLHSVSARQTDGAGNVSEVATTDSWTVDATAPATPVISSAPSGLTTSNSANITFTSEVGAQTVCKVDAGYWHSCTSPQTLTDLSDGPHTFYVKATDSVLNISAPATAEWSVDATAPDAPTVTSPANSGKSGTTAPFNATGEDGAKLFCSLDGGDYAICPSASGVPGDQSTHTVGWNTKLHWGEASDWSKFKWGAKLPGGVIWLEEKAASDFPDGVTLASLWGNAPISAYYYGNSCENLHSAAVIFNIAVGVPNGSGDPTAYNSFAVDCSDTSTLEVPAGGPAQFGSLSAGEHTLAVKQVDAAGNESAVTTNTWTVDNTAEVPVLSGVPSDLTNLTSADISFTGEDGASFKCSLDAATYSDCTSPLSLTDLALGDHTLSVIQTDAYGNVSEPATAKWTVVELAAPSILAPVGLKFNFKTRVTTLRLSAAADTTIPDNSIIWVEYFSHATRPSSRIKPNRAKMRPFARTVVLPARECAFWVRVRDSHGNWSKWYSTKK